MLTLLEDKKKDFSQSDVFVIVVREKNEKEILGAKSSDWVIDAVKGYSSILVEKNNDDIIECAKRYLTNSLFTIVLSGNLPLLTKAVIDRVIDYSLFKKVKACKFMGGGAFNSEYLRQAKNIFYDSVYLHDDDAFYLVENTKQLRYATDVLKNRILDYHMSNGVVFKNVQDVLIEKDVVVERGVVIDAGNSIKGNSIISEGAIIKTNNTISNSRIGKNVCVSNSNIEDSVIGDESIIMPYTSINKCTLGKNVVVYGNMCLINKCVKDGRKIKNKEVDK